ncbi:conserved membrane hypothetical protein [Paraburkholderia sabiae]|uniref:hypothetical protein n=1 Tax=Paraburkholderia sabiae TaxID=273251 RepID=UPI001CB0D608|nr:hypothetical protein [Paraburkholderia sabiae]CAG9229368.1 conserved membrane hypothetical protein [Paraburkholderia sabiae]
MNPSFASWAGLLAAPLVVLGAQSLNYALVHVACAQRNTVALGIVSAVAFVFSVAAAWLAYRRWRRVSHSREPNASDNSIPAAHAAFFPLMAMLVAALSALVQLMMWFPQWLLSPCQ